MVTPKLKHAYKNNYAILYVANRVKINNIIYLWLFVATFDNIIYDTIILPISKYKMTSDTLTIYHEDDTPEIFTAVTMK